MIESVRVCIELSSLTKRDVARTRDGGRIMHSVMTMAEDCLVSMLVLGLG